MTTKNIENFNLYIEKTSGKDNFTTAVKDDKGNTLASSKFNYRIDTYILSQLEDSVGKDIAKNAKHIRDFGTELFNVIFAGKVLKYYKSTIEKAGQTRLKLFFKKDQPELLRIPWEFMFDGKNYLSAYEEIAISRVIEGIQVKERGKIPGKIRMLAVVSSPLDLKDYQRLQVEREQMLILQAVDRAVTVNRMEIEFEDEASLRKIQERLEEEEYHILHYTGHGVYSEKQDKGYLLLEDDSGNSREVDNDTVAHLLAGYLSLRLVVLSGCQTAKTSGLKALSDLSTPLLDKGIPAVISMQYSVSDDSAMNLARKFYSELSQGTAVDTALTRARKELLLNEGVGKVDFATPVIYTDNPDCLCTEEIKPQAAEKGFRLKSPPAKNIVLGLEQLGTQFIGRRKELRRIKEDFLSRGVRTIILHGIGGIGKTVTATKIVEKLQGYFQGIYAFDCGGGLTIEEVLLQLNEFLKRNKVDTLEAVCAAQASIEIKTNYLAQVLSQIKLLLIFDNFETLLCEEKKKWQIADAELKKGLKALVTQCKDGSRFLFTSRYTFNITDGRLLNIIDTINLGEMSEPEAIMVMNRFPDIAREGFHTKIEIFQKIGGHPYTINIFAAHARNKSIKEVLMDIAEVTKDMVEFTLLDNSYEQLSSRAKSLIERASVFKKAVPLAGLEWMMRGKGKLKAIDKEIEELIHWGLIIKIEGEPGSSYQVHTLVKDFIKQKIEKGKWKKWLIKGAGFYENLAKTTRNLWDLLDARELYFAAEEYDKAGGIVSSVFEYLHRWGFIELVRRLNQETIKTASSEVKAAALHYLGIIYQRQGEYEKAIDNYNHCLKIAEELEDKKGIAITLHQLGNIHFLQGDYKKATEKCKKSLKTKKELGDKGGIALTLVLLGNIHLEQGDYDKAIELYNRSLKIFKKLEDKTNIAITFHQLGNIHYLQGDYDNAIEKYNQSLRIKEQLGDKGGIAITLHQLGIIHHDQGDYNKALDKHNKSLKIKEQLGDKRGVAATLHELGMIHHDQGDYDKVFNMYNQSLKIKEQIGNKGGIALTLHQLGMIHQEQGDYDRAIDKYNQSLRIKKELGDKKGFASTLGQLGRIHEKKKKYKNAIKNYLIALSIFVYLKSPYKKTVGVWLKELRDKIGKKTFEKHYNEVMKELKSEGKIE